MKNIFTFYILLLLGFFLNAQNLKSPDNNLDLNFTIDEKGRAFYSLNFHDKPVILTSGLGFMLKDNVEWMKIDTLDMMNNFKILNEHLILLMNIGILCGVKKVKLETIIMKCLLSFSKKNLKEKLILDLDYLMIL